MKLNELRRSSAIMPRQSGLQQLLSYVKTLSTDQINKTFVSFTDLEKLGINPGSTYDTPNGIYAYRLEYVLSQLEKKNKDSFEEIVPFAGDAPYFNVFEVEGNILDLGDMDSLKDAFLKLAKVDRTLLPSGYFADTFAKQVWSRSLFIANGKQQTPTSSREIARKWNTVFRKVGIDGVVDPGFGIIHSNEQDQAVFFTSSVIKNVKRFVNTKSSGSVSKQAPFTNEVAIFFRHRVFRHPSISRTLKPAFKTLVNHYLKRVFLKDSGARESARVEYERLLNSLTKQILTACISTGVVENGSNFAKTLVWTIKDALSGGVVNTRFPDNTRVDDEDKIKQIDQWSSKSEEEWKQFIRNFTNSVNAKLPEAETLHIRSMMRTSDSVDDNLLEAGLKESEQKLTELRRSSATMPKQSAADQLLAKAKSIPKSELASYFVSFTKLEKLGINPGSTYDTPNGIYAYPLAYVIKRIKAGMKELSPHMKENGIRLSSVLPFAGDSPFLNIFKANGNVLDLANQEECWHQYDRIARESGLSDGETRFKLPYTYYQKTGARAFWSITLYLANGKQKAPVSSPDIAKRWNTVLRKFGFDGIVDSKGQGVIHSNEPTQAVFFSSSVIKNVKRFVNTANSGNTAKEPLRKEKLGNFFVKRILQTPNLVEKIKANFNSLWFHNCIAAHISDFKLHEKYLSTVVKLEEQIANDIESAITNNQSFGKFLSAGYALSSKINYAVSSGRAAVNVYKIYPKDESSESVEAAVKQYLTPALKRDAWKAFVFSFINTMDTWINNMFRWGDGPDDFAEWISQNVPSHMQESHQVVKSGKLTELRRSSAVMPRKSGVQQLRDYAETLSAEQIANSFISFTAIDKLGINPKSKYDTPNGIYAYPLGSVLYEIQRDMGRTFSSILPFAGESPYFNVFQVEGNVISLHEYDQVEATLKKLIDFGNKVAAANNKKMGALPEEYRQLYTAEELWSYSLYIANGFNEDPSSSPVIARKWATVFRKVGVDGVIDEGAGIIHENEPRQAVFFTSEIIKNVKRFVNTSNDGSTGKKQPSTVKDGTFYMLKWIRIPEVRSSLLPLYKSMIENIYISIMTKDPETKQDAKNKVIDISKQITSLLRNTAKHNHLFGDVTDKVINDIRLPSVIDDDIYLNQRVPDWYYDEEVYKMPIEKMVETIKRRLNGPDFNKVWKEFRAKLTHRVDTAYKTYN